jgi:tRNA(adenine34) deaminase
MGTAAGFLALAAEEAKRAASSGDVPVGCVIVRDGKVVARGRNLREKKQNATLHAEIVAINRACKKLRSWRLNDCEMYVTLEPCLMCIGAILNARIKKVYMGTAASVSNVDLFHENNLNWKTETEMMDSAECRNILIDFFAGKR